MDLLIKKKLVGRISLLSSFQSTHEFKTHFSFTPFVALWFPFTIRKFKVVQGTSAMTISTIWWRYLLLTLHGVLAHQWSQNTFLSLLINDFPLFPRSLFEFYRTLVLCKAPLKPTSVMMIAPRRARLHHQNLDWARSRLIAPSKIPRNRGVRIFHLVFV